MLLGCLLKDHIFSETKVVYGNTSMSNDMVCMWKKKFDSCLHSAEMHQHLVDLSV